uniref:HTH CENPB-type domain-containing protein n=1 Tax=Amphimedon queenslandica TaxID=400682 RepID=A0A1X7VIK3_AMPQE
MDLEVQDFIWAQRNIGAVVTKSTLIAIGKDVVMRHNFCLKEFGGPLDVTKHWAELILYRMKFVKRRGSMKIHVLADAFECIKQNFLSDLKEGIGNGGYT